MLGGAASASTTYTYDSLGRISTATYDNGKQIVYTYDPAGNRSQVVTQAGTNQPPVAVPDTATTNSNTPVIVHVLANDTDADGDTLSVQSVNVANGTQGTASITGSGTTVTFTPKANFSGTDSFGYTNSDGHGHIASAPVTVTITNQPPVAVNDAPPAIALHTPAAIAVLANDSDPEGDPIVITSVTTPTHGTASINAGQSVTYAPIGGNTSNDSFTYYIADNHGNTAHANVAVTISGTNSKPVARDDELDINETGVPVQPQAQFDPRVNDMDPDGDPLTITNVTPGTYGAVGIVGGNQVKYVLNTTITHAPYTQTDTFTYTVSDGNGGSATATVTVYIDVESSE